MLPNINYIVYYQINDYAKRFQRQFCKKSEALAFMQSVQKPYIVRIHKGYEIYYGIGHFHIRKFNSGILEKTQGLQTIKECKTFIDNLLKGLK